MKLIYFFVLCNKYVISPSSLLLEILLSRLFARLHVQNSRCHFHSTASLRLVRVMIVSASASCCRRCCCCCYFKDGLEVCQGRPGLVIANKKKKKSYRVIGNNSMKSLYPGCLCPQRLRIVCCCSGWFCRS